MTRRLRRMVAHGRADARPVALEPLVNDALALAIPNRSLAQLEISIDMSKPLVEVDAVQIQQVLVKSIRNCD